MTPVERLLTALPDARRSGDGWSARCPAHDDRRASLSVSEGADGRALVKCHAGCSAGAITAAVGTSVRDLMPARPGHDADQRRPAGRTRTFPTPEAAVSSLGGRLGKQSAEWTYHDAAGQPVGRIARWDTADGGKEVRPAARHGDEWRVGAMPAPRPLYGLPALAAADRVVVVEGEKAADAARSLGFTATTSAGGSQAADKTDWSPLAGKVVWVLPDNDSPGRKYADTVAGILRRLVPPAEVTVVELPGLPDRGDIVDWIDAHGDAAEPAGMRAEIEALPAGPGQPDTAAPEAGDAETFRPFPVDVLPAPVGRFVAAGARAIGCDPSYLALPLLAALAAAVGTTRRLQLKRGWTVPAIVWAVIVGESGTAKTPAFKLVMRPVRDRQRRALDRHAEAMRQHEADLAQWEKEFAVWKRDKTAGDEPPAKPAPPEAERYVVSDTTVEALAPILMANPRGLLLSRDELAGWFGSFDRYAGKGGGGADAANWLSMFNAESIIVDRKSGLPKTVHVPQAAVCVTGGIQPAILKRVLGSEHRESGMAARLLVSCPPRRAKAWTEADIDPADEERLARLFDRLFDLSPESTPDGETRPVLVHLTPEAKSAWTAFYNAHAAEQATLSGDLSAAWSKLEEYPARLALVLHFVRWAAADATLECGGQVDAASMTAGIALTQWFKREARRVYAMLEETDEERDQRRLIDWIARQDGTASVREVQQGCRWLKEPGAAEAALDGLIRAGRVRWQDVSPTPKGGRPSRRFVLTASSTVYETSLTDVEGEGTVDVDTVAAEMSHYGVPAAVDSRLGADNGRLFLDEDGLPD